LRKKEGRSIVAFPLTSKKKEKKKGKGEGCPFISIVLLRRKGREGKKREREKKRMEGCPAAVFATFTLPFMKHMGGARGGKKKKPGGGRKEGYIIAACLPLY